MGLFYFLCEGVDFNEGEVVFHMPKISEIYVNVKAFPKYNSLCPLRLADKNCLIKVVGGQ
jgi:hypothetical protein